VGVSDREFSISLLLVALNLLVEESARKKIASDFGFNAFKKVPNNLENFRSKAKKDMGTNKIELLTKTITHKTKHIIHSSVVRVFTEPTMEGQSMMSILSRQEKITKNRLRLRGNNNAVDLSLPSMRRSETRK
jgi:hypothetical protein